MLLAALTNILHPVLPETIDHRTWIIEHTGWRWRWIIEHTGWRLQDGAYPSQPGDPPQGGVGGLCLTAYLLSRIRAPALRPTPHHSVFRHAMVMHSQSQYWLLRCSTSLVFSLGQLRLSRRSRRHIVSHREVATKFRLGGQPG